MFTGLLILQYNIPIGTIANTFFSIGPVLQYFLIVATFILSDC